MRVLFVYKYLTLGGVEAVLRARLEGLDACGLEAHAWFFGDYGGRAMFDGVSERIHLGPAEACMDLISEGGFDLVSSIDTEEIFPAFEGGRSRRLVVEVHSAYGANLGYLSRLRELRPAAVLVPSAHHGGFIRSRLGDEIEIRVVPNAVHARFVEEPTAFTPAPIRPAVAWIGRLDDHKNWEGFLEIAGRLVERGRDIETWMVGQPLSPAGVQAFQSRARETGVLARLRWLRGLPHAAMPALYDAVRDSGGTLVTTSRGEAFGMVVAEAMARCCTVVVPAEGPFTEFVSHGESGLGYEPGSVAAAAEQVERILDSAELRLACGRRARQTVLERFAPEPALARLAELFRDLADAPLTTGHASIQ